MLGNERKSRDERGQEGKAEDSILVCRWIRWTSRGLGLYFYRYMNLWDKEQKLKTISTWMDLKN